MALLGRGQIVIEKLGIMPGPWVVDGNDINYLGDPDIWYRICQVPIHRKFPGNLNLILAAPEMLEALIERSLSEDKKCGIRDWSLIEVIEKATGKSWKEIKEIIK